jgi:hypothetical protein
MKPIQSILRALVLSGVVLSWLLPAPAFAQAGPGGLINPGRDCQTIRRCNFTRTGSYRGCISAYSCRTCTLVRSSCAIGRVTSNCRQMRCDWGG